MNFKQLIACSVFMFSFLLARAQGISGSAIDQIMESVSQDLGDDYDYSELVEKLNYYSKNPIDLNKTSGEEFKELIFVSPLQINALLAYREKNGAFIDVLELQNIPGFGLELVRQLAQLVMVRGSNHISGISVNQIVKQGRHDLIFRYGRTLEKQLGFQITDTAKSRYMGTPERLFLRYRYNYGQHIFVSVNTEKDAGEDLFRGAQAKGFDFYSGNLFIKDTGRFKKIVVGDYALQFGQGLAMWAGLGFGKGASIATITKPEIGLRPYSSANEALFFRGIAATVVFDRLSFTPFISYRSLDGGLSSSPQQPDTEISSLSQTGFHRTQTEINNRNTVKQLVYGLTAQYHSRNFNAGLVAYQNDFDHSFEAGKSEYQRFSFSGQHLTNAGLFYNRTWKNIYTFGEVAHSVHSGYSYLNGMLASLSSQASVILLHRNYQRNYQSFYSRAIGEGTSAANEKGFYSGLTLLPARGFELAMYGDFFSFPWLKYRIDAPSAGFEVYARLTYTVKNKLDAILSFKLQDKQQNDETGGPVHLLETVQKRNYRAELNFMIMDNIQIRNRAEISSYQKGSSPAETGYAVFQDFIYNPMQSKLSGNVRFAIFDTPGFDSRIYAYENDVLYGYSIPALQNRGIRFYLNARYTLARGVDFWTKYGVTKYTNKDEIGSGLDLISGSVRADVKFQVRFQF